MFSFFSQRKFKAELIPTLAYIVFFALLFSLGNWQLNRAEEKAELFQAFSSGDTVPMSLEKALAQDNPRYQRIELYGEFIGKKQYLLDNMVNSKSLPGQEVYTPFRTEQGELLIINRGWIPKRSPNEPVSNISNFLSVSAYKLKLSGRLDTLRAPGLKLDVQIPDTEYPKTVQFPDFAQLEADLGEKLVPFQVLLDADNEHGFLREWSPHEMGPDRHLGYAFQWFALAFTLSIIFLVLSFKKINQN